jgi:hypothetical protein
MKKTFNDVVLGSEWNESERRNKEKWFQNPNWWALDYAIVFKGKKCLKYSLQWENIIGEPLALPHPDLPNEIDAILVLDRHGLGPSWAKDHAFFFKGNLCWQFSLIEWKVISFPKKISEVFSGLPDKISKINCVFSPYSGGNSKYGKESAYFFKGNEYWKFFFKDWKVSSKSPEKISKGFKGCPNDIDATLQFSPVASGYPWYTKDKVYFFKGDKYYNYDLEKDQMGPEYPRKIGAFDGMPDNVDAILALGNYQLSKRVD